MAVQSVVIAFISSLVLVFSQFSPVLLEHNQFYFFKILAYCFMHFSISFHVSNFIDFFCLFFPPFLLWIYFALFFLVSWSRTDYWFQIFHVSVRAFRAINFPLRTSLNACHVLICHIFIYIQFYVFLNFP